MAVASSAALVAPARPMASVPTGTPAGICTIESSESTPRSTWLSTGTPSTGTHVFAATMPGKWAAPPAPAMMTSSPRELAVVAYSTADWNVVRGSSKGQVVAEKDGRVWVALPAGKDTLFKPGSPDAQRFEARRVTIEQVKRAISLR